MEGNTDHPPPIEEVIVGRQTPDDLIQETAGNGDHNDMKEEIDAGDKPPGKLLTEIKEKNQQGLLQNYRLLVPGTRIYTKWFGRFKKKHVKKAPYNTVWTRIVLVNECLISKGTRKIWNFASPYGDDIKGHVTQG